MIQINYNETLESAIFRSENHCIKLNNDKCDFPVSETKLLKAATWNVVHGKTTYEWHTDDMRVHTSNIRISYEYIRVTYGWHTSTYECIGVTYGWHTGTYEWNTDGIRVHTSDIWMTYGYIRLTYEWHMSSYR